MTTYVPDPSGPVVMWEEAADLEQRFFQSNATIARLEKQVDHYKTAWWKLHQEESEP